MTRPKIITLIKLIQYNVPRITKTSKRVIDI